MQINMVYKYMWLFCHLSQIPGVACRGGYEVTILFKQFYQYPLKFYIAIQPPTKKICMSAISPRPCSMKL